MTDNQDPRRMKEMMGELARGKPDSIDGKVQGENTAKPSQLDLVIESKGYILLCGYVGSHQELKIDYNFLFWEDDGEEERPDVEFIQNCGFILKGPQVKESIPGLDIDELKIFGHRSYGIIIPDTGEGGVYSLRLTNKSRLYDAEVKLKFGTGVWTIGG
jgi:hypothetical protein